MSSNICLCIFHIVVRQLSQLCNGWVVSREKFLLWINEFCKSQVFITSENLGLGELSQKLGEHWKFRLLKYRLTTIYSLAQEITYNVNDNRLQVNVLPSRNVKHNAVPSNGTPKRTISSYRFDTRVDVWVCACGGCGQSPPHPLSWSPTTDAILSAILVLMRPINSRDGCVVALSSVLKVWRTPILSFANQYAQAPPLPRSRPLFYPGN